MTRGEQLNQKRWVGVERQEAEDFEQLRRMKGRDHIHAGGGAHPGTNAGAVHARVVMSRMLQLVCNRAAGRDSQYGHDGKCDDPHGAFEDPIAHRENLDARAFCAD